MNKEKEIKWIDNQKGDCFMDQTEHNPLRDLFSIHLDMNVKAINDVLGDSVDLVKREFVYHGKDDIKATCFFTDGLVNTQVVEKLIEFLIDKIQHTTRNLPDKDSPLSTDEIIKHLVINPSIKVIKVMEEGIEGILSGDTLVLFDGSNEPLLLSSRGYDARSVSEPATEQVVRGPRDGFTENIRTNTALVRRRIRDPNFRIDSLKIGRKSKTDINIAYIKGVVKEGLVDEVKKRLQKIEMDTIIESGYIEELMEDAPYSPFTTVQSTERPDKVTAELCEGRVAIFVDNTPFVLIVPTYFWQFLQASDDYYAKFYTGSFFRLIRYFAFVISLTLPSIYVMLGSFHQEMIPTPLALTIASGREVIPFPVLLEALIMEISFELMREAGLRMPKPVGQAVSIVGSLIIGQAAVQAGMVSPFMVIVVAITGIASFAIPNYAASFSIRLIRFPLLIASGTLGLLGFAAAFSMLAIHALSIRSFGEAYLAPAAPFQPSDQKDTIIRFPWWKMDKQPQLAEGSENRVEQDSIPQPDEQYPSEENKNTGKKDDQQGEKKKMRRKSSFRKIGRKEKE
jgi:spore germination protein KA